MEIDLDKFYDGVCKYCRKNPNLEKQIDFLNLELLKCIDEKKNILSNLKIDSIMKFTVTKYNPNNIRKFEETRVMYSNEIQEIIKNGLNQASMVRLDFIQSDNVGFGKLSIDEHKYEEVMGWVDEEIDDNGEKRQRYKTDFDFEALHRNVILLNKVSLKEIYLHEQIKIKNEVLRYYCLFNNSDFSEFIYDDNRETEFSKNLNTTKEKLVYLEYVLELKDFQADVLGYRKQLTAEIQRLKSLSEKEKDVLQKGNTKAKHRIQWLLNPTDIIEFFEILYDEKIVAKETKESFKAIARDCFIDSKGRDFDNQNLANLAKQKSCKSKNAYKIEKVVKKYKSTKN